MLIHSLSSTRFTTPQQECAKASNHREGLRFDDEAIARSKDVLKIMESPNYRKLMGDSPKDTLLAWLRKLYHNTDTHNFSVDIIPLKSHSNIILIFRRKTGLENTPEGFLQFTQEDSKIFKGEDVLRVEIPFVATGDEIQQKFSDALEAMFKYETAVQIETWRKASLKAHEDFITSKGLHPYFEECLQRNHRLMQKCLNRIFGGNFGGRN